MAERGIEVDFLSNERDFLRGAGNVEQSLDKIGGSLDELAHDSGAATGKMGDGFKDLGRTAETQLEGVAKDGDRQLEKLESSFRDMADTATRESRQAGDAITKEVHRGAAGAGEGLDNFKDESKQNAAEVAASFDGSAQSIADGFQGLAAVAFSGFGPAGIAAGLAAAAGIGIISTALESSQADALALRQDVAALTADLLESGRKGGPSLDYLLEKLKGLATAAEGVNLAELAGTAKDAGTDFRSLAQAYAGNTDGLKELWREGVKRQKQLDDEATATDVSTSAGARRYAQLEKQSDAQSRYLDYLGRSLGTAREAAKEEELYAKAGGPELEAKAKRAEELADAEKQRLEDLNARRQTAVDAQKAQLETINDAYDSAAGAAGDYWDAESELFDTQAYIDAMNAKAQALKDYQETLASSPLTESAKSFLQSQGVDSAAQFLAGYKAATPEQQRELNRLWTEAGLEGSGVYAGALQRGLPATVNGPRILLNPDDSAVQAYLDSFRSNPVSVPVSLRVLERQGLADR